MKRSFFCSLQLFVLFLCSFLTAKAQADFNWPEDKETALSYYVRYTDSYEIKDYKEAQEPLEWLLERAPKLHKSLYQHAAIIYRELAEQAENLATKRKYQEKVMEMLSLREEYFNDSEVVSNRKALLAYKFYKERPEKLAELYGLLLRAIDLNGEKVYANNLVAVMDVVRRRKKAGDTISQDELVALYNRVSGLLNLKRVAAANDEKKMQRLDKHLQTVDKLFSYVVKIDCELIDNLLGPQAIAFVEEAKGSEEERQNRLKTLLRLLKNHNCDKPEMELKALGLLYSIAPTSEFALVLARKFLKEQNNPEVALNYYKEALEKSTDNKERASVYLDMARIEFQAGKKVASRSYARKALQEDPGLSDAYTLIGSLYMNSYKECKKGVNRVEDHLVYIAAYNMFQKSGSKEMMSAAQAQFPTAEQIFELGLEEGTELMVGCWIQEKVILAKAP